MFCGIRHNILNNILTIEYLDRNDGYVSYNIFHHRLTDIHQNTSQQNTFFKGSFQRIDMHSALPVSLNI